MNEDPEDRVTDELEAVRPESVQEADRLADGEEPPVREQLRESDQ